MHCGIVATVEGERLTRVEGDRESKTRGFLCLNGHALPELVGSTERLRAPRVRSRRGEPLVESSFEEAYRRIAERLSEVKARFGARALAVQLGWPFVRHPMFPLFRRFCHAFGTPNVATDASLCAIAGRLGRALVAGVDTVPDLEHARTLLLWGANPTHSYPPFAHQCGAFGLQQPRALVVVDPIRTELAERAQIHLQVRPGTDGALALALIHVLLDRGLVDRAEVESRTVGLSALARLAAEFPPQRAAAICAVESALVVRAAELLAAGRPTAIWDGLGVEHHDNGVQTVRAVAAVGALLGSTDAVGGNTLVDKPGPRFFDEPLPLLGRGMMPEPVPPPPADVPIGQAEHPLFEVFTRQAQSLLFPQAILEDRPYPLRALILFGSNPLSTSPGAALLSRAYAELELLVVVDPFLSATAERADVVLPAATFAEAEGLVAPVAGARTDFRILSELAGALGLGSFFPASTLAEALSSPEKPLPLDRPALVPERQDALPRFPTLSGKLELASTLLERYGLDPLPRWTEPEPTSADFPLRLVSGPRTRAHINSQLHGVPSVALCAAPEPEAELHPSLLEALGIAEGARVAVVSKHGRAFFRARPSDRIQRDSVLVPHGFAGEANVNQLTAADRRDPISGFPVLRSVPCRVERT
jgi:anaerobic selenocysteine-containing dehydrogenase